MARKEWSTGMIVLVDCPVTSFIR